MSKPMALIICFTALATCANEVAESLDTTLRRRTSFSVETDSLTRTLSLFAEQIRKDDPEFAIEILADDLKQEGITRNVAIRNLKLEDKSVAEVLTAIVIKANSSSAVKSPDDPQLRLIWILGSDPKNAKRRIVLVTTRAAAKKRGDTLPDGFEASK